MLQTCLQKSGNSLTFSPICMSSLFEKPQANSGREGGKEGERTDCLLENKQ